WSRSSRDSNAIATWSPGTGPGDPGEPGSPGTPGLRPGSVRSGSVRPAVIRFRRPVRGARDEIWVALELAAHVLDHASEVAAVNGCHVIASRPTDRSWNLPVGASRGYRLCQPNEVAQARARSKTDDDMHVVSQYRVAQHAHTRPAATPPQRAANVHRRRQVEAPHAVPRVPLMCAYS